MCNKQLVVNINNNNAYRVTDEYIIFNFYSLYLFISNINIIVWKIFVIVRQNTGRTTLLMINKDLI